MVATEPQVWVDSRSPCAFFGDLQFLIGTGVGYRCERLGDLQNQDVSSWGMGTLQYAPRPNKKRMWCPLGFHLPQPLNKGLPTTCPNTGTGTQVTASTVASESQRRAKKTAVSASRLTAPKLVKAGVHPSAIAKEEVIRERWRRKLTHSCRVARLDLRPAGPGGSRRM